MNDRMMRCILALFIIFIWPQIAWSQTDITDAQRANFAQIDKHATDAPRDAENDFDSLVKYLIKPAKTDLEKARAIYAWVTHKVAYDTEEYFSGKLCDADPEEALKTRKSICGSYAALYEYMAELAGLEVTKVDGYAKGFGYITGTPIDNPINHSWNAVKIDGKWHLLDCAWGAGYVGSDRKFVYKFSEFYFLSPPDQLIYTHFPSNSKWQLLETPISKQDFIDCPNLRPGFFSSSLRMLDKRHGKIKSDGIVTLTLASAESVALQVKLRKGEQKLDDSLVFAQKEEDNWKVRAAFPSDGTYTVKLFAKPKDSTGNYEWVADYMVESKSSGSSPKEFPKMFQPFYTRNACLYSPMSGRLKENSVENFKISVPGAENVSVIIAGKWTALQKCDKDFEGDVEVGPGEVVVVAKYPGCSTCDVLLKYNASTGSAVAQGN